MSNEQSELLHECTLAESCEEITMLLTPREKNLGAFTVRRSLPTTHLKTIGPWIFFDHMGPAEFPAGKGIDVRPHPHIGIATVTYLFDGEILHRDSLGSTQAIKPGDINLMVAGKGIVHSERERDEVRCAPHVAHGLQLWLALPEEQEEIEPAFYHYASENIPFVDIEGVSVRVLMGSVYGVESPVKTFSETLYIEASLTDGQTLRLPDSDELGLYVVTGQVIVGETNISAHSMAVFQHVKNIQITASENSKIAVVGGKNIGTRHIDWNFVSSRKDRIEQARHDWKGGHFPKVPSDEDEFIPLPE